VQARLAGPLLPSEDADGHDPVELQFLDMHLDVYNACLADKPLGEALDIIAGLGLNSVEIKSGGFLPPIHLPVAELLESEDARQAYVGEFASRGLRLTALNCMKPMQA